jgi:hypothetical protein
MTADLMRSLTLVTVLFVAAIVSGIAGRRWRNVRLMLTAIGPLYSLGVLGYSLIEGSTSICTGSGGTFTCNEVTYASTWGASELIAVGVAVILTMAPLASAWRRNGIPSIAAAIALPVVMALFWGALGAWVPAWAAVLAAAIAGPPSATLGNAAGLGHR